MLSLRNANESGLFLDIMVIAPDNHHANWRNSEDTIDVCIIKRHQVQKLGLEEKLKSEPVWILNSNR